MIQAREFGTIPDWLFALCGPNFELGIKVMQSAFTRREFEAWSRRAVIEQLEEDVLVARGVADGSVVLFPSSSEVA